MESRSLAETEKFAQDFLANLRPEGELATVVGLYGDLGSGKTTFVQALGRALGLTEPMTSPTFVIQKNYLIGHSVSNQGWDKLIHIDAYRLESGAELVKLDFSSLISNPQHLILVEWADRVADILGQHTKVFFKFIDDQTRQINFA